MPVGEEAALSEPRPESAPEKETVEAVEAVGEKAEAEAETAGETLTEAEPSAEGGESSSKKNKFEFSKAMAAVFAALVCAIKFLSRSAVSGAKCFAAGSKTVFKGTCSFLGRLGGMAARAAKSLFKTCAKALKAAASGSIKALKEQLSKILPALCGFLGYIGKSAFGVLSAVARAVFGAIWRALSTVFGAVGGWIFKKLKQPLYDVWCFVLTPFAHAYGSLAHAHIHFKKASKKGFIHAVKSALASIWKFFGGICEVLKFSFNYAAPIISIVFLISLIRYASTIQYAITVEYNGSELGTIDNEVTYNEAQSLVQDKITFTENDAPIIETPKFSVAVMNLDDNSEQPLDDIDALSELIIEGGDVSIVYAYGLYINNELYGVYSESDMEIIRAALNDKLNSFSSPDSVEVRFEDDIVISEGRFIEDVLVPAESALELINGSTEVEAYYSVNRGDTISGVCESLGITRAEFDADNPSLSGGIRQGDIVTYHYLEPHLNVITTHYEVYDQVIERTTEYVESSRYEQYCEILLQHGSDGLENVTALVTEVNGKESDRTVVSRTILEEMVPRKFRVGTKENTYLEGDTEIIDTLGTFCWPLGDEDCYISSNFGYRSWDHSNHKAIDIAGIPRGTPIYAACDGKVTFSGWYADYGKLVIVDCGHGYQCYYGHCSELLVSVGDRVEKGDTIAKVGMTGSASGNHLHFEMRLNKDRINPFLALGGPGGHRYNPA